MKYAFIQSHRADFPIRLSCEVLGVSTSGYYDWVKHVPGKQALSNHALDVRIKALYEVNHQRCGSPRMTRLLKAQGECCSENRVARRMKAMGLQAVAKRKFKVTTDSTHAKPVYDNVLNRDFSTIAINQKWCGDISYVHTQQGWLYLAVVIDLHSRAVIGWAMAKRMKTALVCDALMMALIQQGFPKGVIVHSDRGSQYCSKRYQKIITRYQLIGSMSRKGNCWDNAIAESFFHTLKVELIHQQVYNTRTMARQCIFQYIESYYNRNRLHSSIGFKTPYEVLMAA